MPQIIDEQNYSGLSGLGRVAGSTIGYGSRLAQDIAATLISGGLNQLMQRQQQRSQQVEQQQLLNQGLQGLGFTSEQSQQLSQLPIQVLAPFIKEHSRAKVSQDVTSPGLQAIVPGLSKEEAQAVAKLSPGLQQQWYRNVIGNLPQAEAVSPQEEALNQYTRQDYQPTPYEYSQQAQQQAPDVLSLLAGQNQRGIPDIGTVLAQQGKPVAAATPTTAPTLTPESNVVKELKGDEERRREHFAKKEAERIEKEAKKEAAAERKRTLTEKAQAERIRKEQERAQKISQTAADKETKASWDSLKKSYSSAKEMNADLTRLEKIISGGKITPYAWNNLLETIEEINPTVATGAGAAIGGALGAVGGPAGSLVGARTGGTIGAVVGGLIRPIASLARSATQKAYPDTDEFNKLSDSFIRYAKDVFPGRVTDTDLRAFMRTVVNLSQTESGKKRIIQKMRLPIKVAETKYAAARDIIKENNGHRPVDFDEQIEDRTKDKIDKFYKQFIQGMTLSS